MKIIIDTREQRPFDFIRCGCEAQRGTLKTGDYSIAGFEDRVAVERKTLTDLIGCLTDGRERFEAELARMREFESCAVVVESPFRALVKGKYRSGMSPFAAVQSVLSMTQKFRMPFLFAESRAQAQFLTYHFLRHFDNHHKEKANAVSMSTGARV